MNTDRTVSLRLAILTALFAFVCTCVPESVFAQNVPPLSQADCATGTTYEPGIGATGENTSTCRPNGTSVTAGITKNRENKPTTCESFWAFFTSPIVCTGRTISAFIGTALITVSAWILQVTAVLFNWMIYYTIIAFGDSTNGFLTASVLDSINEVWSVFRDISNILIIGLFIFIALSIILGLKEFGQKKMIARVLIIAVLMNFSLLFTKMIIDASNFVAHQFYTASSVGAPTTSPSTTATVGSVATEFTQNGISGQFIRLMGVTSISDTFTTLRVGADAVDNGYIALLNGVFAAIILFAAAAVFFYGSFLLVVRAVFLVFLLITSSLAFATFLIPKLSTEGSGNKFGWNAWWSALLRNAVFAPLLLMMLWVALVVSGTLVGGRGGSLGALLANPQGAGSIAALFNYVIVLGLLFAAIKISSSFSTSIGGFSFAAALPFNLATGLGAPLMRQTVGRIFAGRADRLAGQAKDDRAMATKARTSSQIHELYGNKALAAQATRHAAELEHSAAEKAIRAAKAAKIGDRKFNLNDTKAVQAVGKGLGLPLAGSAKDTKGYSSQIKETAKHAAETAEKAGEATREELAKNQELLRNAAKGPVPQIVEKTAERDSARDALTAVKEATQAQRELIESEKARHTADLTDAKGKKVEYEKKIITTEVDPSKTIDEKVRERASHEEEIAKQTDRIKRASINLENVEERSAALRNKVVPIETPKGIVPMSETQAQSQFDNARRELVQTQEELKRFGNQAAAIAGNTAGNIAENVGRHEVGIFGKAIGIDDKVAKSARDQLKGSKELKNWKKMIESEMKKDEHGGGTLPTAPAAPSGGEDHH